MTSERFLKKHHLRKGAEFDRVYRRRCSASDAFLLVYACENDLLFTRLGLSVSRKVGNAVARNRWKRIIREAFRLSRERLPLGIDLVVIPRPTAEARLAAVKPSLARLAQQAARRLERDAQRRGRS